MMNRRAFLCGLTFGPLTRPLAGEAQQTGRAVHVGVLGPTPMNPAFFATFKQELSQFGYAEGRNLILEYRYGEGALLAEFAADLVRLNVDVIFARGPAALTAVKDATRTIAVVAIDLESDPVAEGFVRSLAQPGGNITGVFLDLPELSGKQLQLLKEVVPPLSRVAVIGDPVLNGPQFRATELAAKALAMHLQSLAVREMRDFNTALEDAKRGRARAVLLLSSPLVFAYRAQIGALAIQKQLPAVSMFVEFAEAGGLMAYGPSVRETYQRCARYVGKVLQGSKPGALPIERPEKFELVINLKTAKALGLTIPPSVLGRVDHVIE